MSGTRLPHQTPLSPLTQCSTWSAITRADRSRRAFGQSQEAFARLRLDFWHGELPGGIERKDHVRFVLLLPLIIHAGQYSEEVVGKHANPIGENATGRSVVDRTHGPQAANQR